MKWLFFRGSLGEKLPVKFVSNWSGVSRGAMATPQDDEDEFFSFENEVVFVEETDEATIVSYFSILA